MALSSKRRERLDALIADAEDMIGDYEDILLDATDPKTCRRCRREIAKTRQLVKGFRADIEGSDGLSDADDSPAASVLTQRVDTAEARLGGQDGVLLGLISGMGRLNEAQRDDTRAILAAVDAGRLDAAAQRELVAAVREVIPALQEHADLMADADVAAALQRAEDATSVTSSAVDLKTRVKVSAWIIPLLLSVEQEIELGSGVSLDALWRRLTRKGRRAPDEG